MSKAEKMRGRLASIQRDREQFERQKKELENDMNVGRDNMNKIKKGLKNNSIASEAIVVDEKLNNHHYGAHASPAAPGHGMEGSPLTGNKKLKRQLTPNGTRWTDGNSVPNSALNSPCASQSHSMSPRPQNGSGTPVAIMPTGPRISDWCYAGLLDSAPPVVKVQEMYENVRFLGRGAFGDVSLVKNIEDNKLFAVKEQLVPKESEYQSVLHEVRFLRANRHPCIIDVHDAFLTLNPRIVHIVMHYCESGNLATFISNAKKNRTSIPETQVIKWLLQLALALQFLHHNRVIHRDLKPMNIMLTEGGDLLKLGDFGLAMRIDDAKLNEVGEAGTPYYTAPEMIQREPYSYPADCWSCGVVLHQILALERPFDGNSTAELVKSILTVALPALPSHYSEEIRMVARHLLRRKPEERLTMTELLADQSIYSKAVGFPQQFRPKAMEERIRRSNMRQLEMQLEAITAIRKKLTPLSEKDKLLEPEGIPKDGAKSEAMSRANSDVTEVTQGDTFKAPQSSADGIKGIALPPDDNVAADPAVTTPNTNPNTSDGALSVTPADEVVQTSTIQGEETITMAVVADDEQQTHSKAVAELLTSSEEEGEPDPEMEKALRELIGSTESADSDMGILEVEHAVKEEVGDHPHGGRIGQELAKAIEADHYFETHEEEVKRATVSALEGNANVANADETPNS